MLVGVVKGVDVVVRPSTRARALVLFLHVLNDHIAQLRTEAKLVDCVGESMRVFVLEVVLQVVYVKVAVGERLSGCNVEVSNHFVDADATFETTSFLTLLVEVLGVMFPLTLLYTFPTTERP